MRRVLGLAVILVLLAGACSSQDDSAVTTPSTETSRSTSVSSTTSTTQADAVPPLRCESPPEPAVRADEMAVTVFFTCADGTLENLVRVGRAVISGQLHDALCRV